MFAFDLMYPDEGGTITSLDNFDIPVFTGPGLGNLALSGDASFSHPGLAGTGMVQDSLDGKFGGAGFGAGLVSTRGLSGYTRRITNALSGVGDGTDVSGGFDISSFLSGSGTSLLIVGGIALYLMFNSDSAKEKRRALGALDTKYKTRRRRIKQSYGLFGTSKTISRARRGARQEGDIFG